MSKGKMKFWISLSMIVVLSTTTFFILNGTKPAVQAGKPDIVVSLSVNEPKPLPLTPPFEAFVNYMEHELDSSGTVGAAYTLVQNGRVVHTGCFGELKRGSDKAVNEHTLFRLASVSKGFAGVLAGLLANDSVFSLDDRVVDHYPAFELKDSTSTVDMTIRNLLSHTSGLVPYAFDNLVEADQDLASIVDRLDEVNISAPPGKLYGYQNVMFSMLDPIAGASTGKSYPELLKQRIFDPLGMEDASAGPVPSWQALNMAYPHVRTRNGYVSLNPHEGYYNVLPAAGVNASISDMGKWLVALLGYQPEEIPDTVLHTIASPVIYTPLKWRYTRYWKPFKERYYSLGWRVYYYQGRTIVYHGGYIRGYRAEIAFCPSEDIGIAFMMNSPNNLASRAVPTFMDLVLE